MLLLTALLLIPPIRRLLLRSPPASMPDRPGSARPVVRDGRVCPTLSAITTEELHPCLAMGRVRGAGEGASAEEEEAERGKRLHQMSPSFLTRSGKSKLRRTSCCGSVWRKSLRWRPPPLGKAAARLRRASSTENATGSVQSAACALLRTGGHATPMW